MPRFLLRWFNARNILHGMEPCGEIPPESELLQRAFKIAWPSTLESFLVALAGVVDTIMVSALGSYAIAAVGLTAQPKFLCLAIFIAMNVAVSALVARRRGEGDRAGANRVLKQALLLTGIFTLLISVVGVVFAPQFLRLAGTNADTHDAAVAYFRIITGGMVFNVFSMVINAAQRGVGKTKIAMTTNIVSNLVNIALNYCLIGGHFGFPAWGVAGAAVATVAGTVVALVLSVRSVLSPDGYLYLLQDTGKGGLDTSVVKGIVNIGGATFLEQVFLRIGFMLFVIVVASLGTNALAAHQVGMNILSISFSLGDGLSVACVALVGRSLGEKRHDLAKIYAGYCQRMGLICSLCVALIYTTVGRNIFALFSPEAEILNYGTGIMRIIGFIVIMQIAQVVFSGCLRGAGDTRFIALVAIISVLCIRPFFGWLMVYPLGFGLIGAWFGIAIDQAVRLMLTWLRFRGGKWMHIQI